MQHYGRDINLGILNFGKMALRNNTFFLELGLFYAKFGSGLI